VGKAVRVIVTGSRAWADISAVIEALSFLPPGSTVVHGGCAGADSCASSAAGYLGLIEEEHIADWNKHGKSAGPLRNQKMIDLGADLVLAFPLLNSRGTWDCIRRAKLAGIDVRIIKTGGG
jgi:hypothetical protein